LAECVFVFLWWCALWLAANADACNAAVNKTAISILFIGK